MKWSIFALVLLAGTAWAEQTKTTFNAFTGKLDFITRIDTNTIVPGSGVNVSCTGGACTLSSAATSPTLLSSGIAFGSATNTLASDTGTLTYNDTSHVLQVVGTSSASIVYASSSVFSNSTNPGAIMCAQGRDDGVSTAGCFLADIGPIGYVGNMIYMDRTLGTDSKAFGVFADVNNPTSGANSITTAGYFYAANGAVKNVALHGEVETAPGTAKNYGGEFLVIAANANADNYGVWSRAAGGGTNNHNTGGYFQATGGGASLNVALYAEATGASTNRALQVASGDVAFNSGVTDFTISYLTASQLMATDSNKKVVSYDLFNSSSTWTGYQNFRSSTSYTAALYVSSSVAASGSVGTSGQFLTSGGPGATPSWTTAGGSGGYAVEPSTVIFILSKGLITAGATFYQNGYVNFAAAGSSVTISSNTILPGATFYQNGNTVMGMPGFSVIHTSNTVMTGTTFYQNGNIATSLAASFPVQTNASSVLTAAAIDVSGGQATGILAAGRFPALTGDITTVSGALATSAASLQTRITTFSSSITVTNLNGFTALYGVLTGTSPTVIGSATGHTQTSQLEVISANQNTNLLLLSTSTTGNPAMSVSTAVALAPTDYLLTVSSSQAGATPSTMAFGIQNGGHFISSGTTPTPSSCGATFVINGTDNAFTVTPGAGATGCTITFSYPFGNNPVCIVKEQTESLTNVLSYTHSATQIVISQVGAASATYDVVCIGQKQ